MRNSSAILVAVTIGMLSVGGAATAAQKTAPQTQGQIEASRASADLTRGDNWIATNELKRAVAKEPTILNRFNLATAYERTGRLTTAKTYYQALAKQGKGKTMRVAAYHGGSRKVDIGTASADRLLYIDWVRGGKARRSGAVSAESVGENVSATVGGKGEREVTDDQARALDRRARLHHP